MLIQKLHYYFHYLWFLLAGVVILKIFLHYLLNTHLEGFSGFLFATFKWFGEQDQELEESTNKKTLMRVLNVITIGIYFVIALMLLLYFIPMFIPVNA